MGSEWHWLAPLERHRQRRRQGVPTVTVMVGPAGAAEWIWKQWHGADGEPRVLVARVEHLIGGWLGETSVLERLRDAIRREVARLERIPVAELKSLIGGRSPGQLEELAVERATQLQLDADWLRWALGLSEAMSTRAELWRCGAVAKLATLLGGLPPLLVRPASPEALGEVAQRLFEISEETPRVDLALAVDESALSRFRASASARLMSALTEGLIALRPQGRGPSALPEAAIEYDEETLARSLAERTLYEALQRRARTHGLFALNVELDIEPPMEVDLLCKELKLAIEIDGYHHFRDAHGYRRDRRKDVRLQELGYLVVRVLATDVDRELAHVLESIDRVVADRQRSDG